MRQLDLFEASHEVGVCPPVPAERREELVQRMAEVILAVVSASPRLPSPVARDGEPACCGINPKEKRDE